MNLNLIFSQVGIPSDLAQDTILLIAVLLFSFIFGMFIGRYKLVTILINIYISLALLVIVPQGYLIDYSYKILFFLISLVILTLFSKRLFDISISGAGSGFLLRVFVMSFLEVMLLISSILYLMPKKEALGYISKTSYYYLVSPNFHFFWAIAPLIFIFMIYKRLNR